MSLVLVLSCLDLKKYEGSVTIWCLQKWVKIYGYATTPRWYMCLYMVKGDEKIIENIHNRVSRTHHYLFMLSNDVTYDTYPMHKLFVLFMHVYLSDVLLYSFFHFVTILGRIWGFLLKNFLDEKNLPHSYFVSIVH